MYLMIGTCPDLVFAVCKLAHFCESPISAHLNAVKHVLRYIDGTLDLRMCFSGSSQLDTNRLSEFAWAGDTRDRKSTSGYVLIMADGAISEYSCKWSDSTTSTYKQSTSA